MLPSHCTGLDPPARRQAPGTQMRGGLEARYFNDLSKQRHNIRLVSKLGYYRLHKGAYSGANVLLA